MSTYYQKNRERILKGMARKVKCETCNKMIAFSNFPKHKRTRRHNELLNKDCKTYDSIENSVAEIRDRQELIRAIISANKNVFLSSLLA